MKTVIGIFLAQTDPQCVEQWLKTISPSITGEIFTYSGFGQLKTITAQCRHLDGAVFDLESACDLAISRGWLRSIPTIVMSPGSQELYIEFFRLLKSNPEFDFSRLLVDCQIEHIDEEIFDIASRPVFVPKSMSEKNDPTIWEGQIIRKYYSAWKSNCFDMIITRHSLLIKKLKSMGVTAEAINLGQGSFERTIQVLETKIIQKKAKAGQTVFAVVGIRAGTAALDQLRRELEQFNTEYNHAFLITRRTGLFEVETTRKLMMSITDDCTHCKMLEFLRKGSEHVISLGWGVGNDAMSARANAIRAYREAMFDEQHQAYISDDEGYLSPISSYATQHLRDEQISQRLDTLKEKTGISKRYLKKLMEISEKLPDNIITTQMLSKELNITRRTAARTMLNLEEKGIARPLPTVMSEGAGRPQKCWRVLI